MELPALPFERILKDEGAKRVSDRARYEFRNLIEKHAKKISRKAIKLSKHAKRQTVRSCDIRMAFED